MIDPVALILALITISTPVLLAALGELIVEKSGTLNLGVEGMMIIGAVCGYIVAHQTGSPTLAFIAGMAGAAALSAIFAVLTLFLMANQVASGLALTLFGLGLAALLGVGYEGQPIPDVAKPLPEALRGIPVIGPILLSHDLVTYLAIAAVFVLWYVLKHTRTGLVLRAVGESHDAAHALGYKVIRIRFAAILFGGAMAGLGGAFLSIVYVENWVQGMTAGAGWIALALVVFAAWKPGRVLFGAWLFGGIAALQLRLQASGTTAGSDWLIQMAAIAFWSLLFVGVAGLLAILLRGWKPGTTPVALLSVALVMAGLFRLIVGGVTIPVAVLDASPYIVTIMVLVFMSSNRTRVALNAPAALGKTFHPSG